VQTVLPTRPEFKDLRDNTIPSPMGRTGDRAFRVQFLDLPYPCLECFPRGKGPALVRCPCAELRAARPLGKVSVRFFGQGPCHLSLDPDLPVQRLPPEEESRAGAARDLTAFAAFVIRVEDKPPLVERAQEDHARGGASIGTDGRNGHRIRYCDDRAACFLIPVAKQIERS